MFVSANGQLVSLVGDARIEAIDSRCLRLNEHMAEDKLKSAKDGLPRLRGLGCC